MTQLKHEPGSVGDWFDRIDRPAKTVTLTLAILPLMILLLLPTGWHSNEEHYYQLAYRHVAPDEFSPYSAIFDRSNARFLYETIAGAAVAILGYDTTQIIFRVAQSGLYAIGLGLLFSTLGLSIPRALAAIVLFLIARQHMTGREWLFLGTEAKTFAYAAVLPAIALALRGRWLWSMILMALATYFHFQVGGFWAIALVALLVLRKIRFARVSRLFGVYILLVAPLIAIIIIDQFGHHIPDLSNVPHPDVIYAERVFHHAALFSTPRLILSVAKGALIAGGFLVLFLYLEKRSPDPIRLRFMAILMAYYFIAALISYLDRHTHFFAKFYLFRPTSLMLLLAIAVTLSLVPQILRPTRQRVVILGSIGVIAGFVAFQLDRTEWGKLANRFGGRDLDLNRAIASHSAQNEIVLIEPQPGGGRGYRLGLHRKIPRPTLVERKFIPSNPADLVRWYRLLEFREDLFRNGCRGPLPYPVHLLVVINPDTLTQVESCGPVIWEGRQLALVRVDP